MSKMTNEDKANLISEACELFRTANNLIIKGKKLIKRCGVECCTGFNEDNEFLHDKHIQLYSGIKKLSKIIGKDAYHKRNWCDEIDNGCLHIDHNGIVFCQLGQERTSTRAKFSFR